MAHLVHLRPAHLQAAIFVAISIILSACASGQVGSLPAATPTAAANVHVIRPYNFFGSAIAYRIAYDGQNLFDINSGRSGSFPIPAGLHDVELKCFGSGIIPIMYTKNISETFLTGQNYYFVLSPDVISCATIRAVPIAEGLSLMAQVKPIKLDN